MRFYTAKIVKFAEYLKFRGMKIGIIVAMGKELALLLPLLEDSAEIPCGSRTFFTGRIAGHEIVAMQSGIGKVNAALSTQCLIDNFQPELIINTGVAGGTGYGAGVLDVVIGDRVAYHDVWCGPDTVPGQAAGSPLYFESDRRVVDLPCLNENAPANVRHGLVCSGDIFVAHESDVERILDMFPQAEAVDMESAAIAQVCHINNVAFFCLRVVSDTPGAADNLSQYESFWDDAPRSTFTALTHILSELK